MGKFSPYRAAQNGYPICSGTGYKKAFAVLLRKPFMWGQPSINGVFFMVEKLKDTIVFFVYARVAANRRKAITNIKQQSPPVIRITFPLTLECFLLVLLVLKQNM